MSERKDGGPAFPHPVPVGAWGDPSQGMTLRDYFAGKALQGILSNGMSQYIFNGKAIVDGETLAKCAYEFADTMLAERAR